MINEKEFDEYAKHSVKQFNRICPLGKLKRYLQTYYSKEGDCLIKKNLTRYFFDEKICRESINVKNGMITISVDECNYCAKIPPSIHKTAMKAWEEMVQ